jgi:hypothetical protein
MKIYKINTHDNYADMMAKSVPVVKFELFSSLVGITVYSKWMFVAKNVSFVV